jgi:predicted dehydrogenase
MSRISSRRSFLRTVAAGTGAVLSIPASSYARVVGANDRIHCAIIGTNGRGHQLARGVADVAGTHIAYVCDVDERAIAKTIETIGGVQDQQPAGEKDFRRALEDPELDTVVIATPNHWHTPATILACQAGKHVYVEKPGSHNAREAELVVEAARRYDRVVQVGNQRRSWPNIIAAIEEVRSGTIGEVHYAKSWYANRRGPTTLGNTGSPPSWLDYELWQGPAPHVPYRDNLIHYNWHWFWHWGNGEAGNNGVHTVDLCRWGLGVDYPSRVVATGGRYYYDDDWQTPDTQVLTFEFPDGRYIMWEGLSTNAHRISGSGVGTSFHGADGTVVITGHGYRVLDERDTLVKEVTPQSGVEPTDAEGRRLNLDTVHLYDFFEATRSNRIPNSDVGDVQRSTLLCHLGNISWRVGRGLTCNPENGHILQDEEAAALWGREYEPGWQVRV